MPVELVLLSGVSFRGREIMGSRLRGLLALLAEEPRAGCGTGRLVSALWPDERPEHPAKALQVLVSRARSRLGAEAVVSTATGYRLALPETSIDAAALAGHRAAAQELLRAGANADALAEASAGLVLCAGAAGWGGEVSDPLSALRAARVPAYRAVRRVRALALARLGRHGEAFGELSELAEAAPRDEEVLGELLRCEAITASPAAALARYDGYRGALRAELGSDPGAGLRAVHAELLRADTPVVRHGVSHEPNALLGRDSDLAAVSALLRTARVTSIVGVGGLGKTRLANAVGNTVSFPVVHFVPLAGVGTDAEVAGEVAAVLGVGDPRRPGDSRDLVAGIAAALAPGPALLVLDNCEHVVGGAAELVRALVSLSRELRVLTTSRAPLGLSSESVYPLPELDLPTAVALFGQRARAARPGVELPAGVVRGLCGQLDGLPLAVELAAARVRVLSVAEIARRLDDRFAVLRGSARDAPQRHRTLHAVIDWSWHLLAPQAQVAMRALSIFPGGFTGAAAQRLLDSPDAWETVEQLVDQSLLKVAETATGTRFRMLETVREFSTAHRLASGDGDAVTARFLGWAREFGVSTHDALSGADLPRGVGLVRAEQDNLVAALRVAVAVGDGATVVACTGPLGLLWFVESNFARLTALVRDTAGVLARCRPRPELVESTRTAAVLCAVAAFLIGEASPVPALVALRRLPAAQPDTFTRAAHMVLLTAARSPAELGALCAAADPLLAGVASHVASYRCEYANDLAGALAAARRMLAAFERQDAFWLRALAHGRIGELCLLLEPGAEGLRHLNIALSFVEEMGAVASAVRGRWAVVLAHLQRGAFDEAERWLVRNVEDEAESGLPLFESVARAEIALGRNDIEAGLRGWRNAARQLRIAGQAPADDFSGLSSWGLDVQVGAVLAHADHNRLAEIGELAEALPRTLAGLLATPLRSYVDVQSRGELLLGVAVVDLAGGESGAGRSVARMIALAQRHNYRNGCHVALTPDRVRELGRQADRSAYLDAVSRYADLDWAGLSAAAQAALRARERFSGWGRAGTAPRTTDSPAAPGRRTS